MSGESGGKKHCAPLISDIARPEPRRIPTPRQARISPSAENAKISLRKRVSSWVFLQLLKPPLPRAPALLLLLTLTLRSLLPSHLPCEGIVCTICVWFRGDGDGMSDAKRCREEGKGKQKRPVKVHTPRHITVELRFSLSNSGLQGVS
jgi:hypothetical protein